MKNSCVAFNEWRLRCCEITDYFLFSKFELFLHAAFFSRRERYTRKTKATDVMVLRTNFSPCMYNFRISCIIIIVTYSEERELTFIECHVCGRQALMSCEMGVLSFKH